MTYLQVSLRNCKSGIVVGTFDTVNTLATDSLAMSTILLSETQEGFNRLLI